MRHPSRAPAAQGEADPSARDAGPGQQTPVAMILMSQFQPDDSGTGSCIMSRKGGRTDQHRYAAAYHQSAYHDMTGNEKLPRPAEEFYDCLRK